MRDREQDADGQTDAQTDRQRDRPRPILPRFATPSHKNELVRLAAADANRRAVTDKRDSLTGEADSSAVVLSFVLHQRQKSVLLHHTFSKQLHSQ